MCPTVTSLPGHGGPDQAADDGGQQGAAHRLPPPSLLQTSEDPAAPDLDQCQLRPDPAGGDLRGRGDEG